MRHIYVHSSSRQGYEVGKEHSMPTLYCVVRVREIRLSKYEIGSNEVVGGPLSQHHIRVRVIVLGIIFPGQNTIASMPVIDQSTYTRQ